MIRKNTKAYLFLLITLLSLLSLSKKVTEPIKGLITASLHPFWEIIIETKLSSNQEESLQKLQLENTLLKSEISHLQKLLQQEKLMDLFAVPAKVIYRSPSMWHSSLWINVGESQNRELGKNVVAKNSPVVLGNGVVGVIDYVGDLQSRVRLITDSALTVAVRVVRNLPAKKVEYLAKGELRGGGKSTWRSQGFLLKGTGFNYDFADIYGPSRELQTGTPEKGDEGDPIELVKERDLLVTSGLDGIFPVGLRIATVTKVISLKEGDYYYDIEAKPIIENLNNLSILFVLPPLGFDLQNQP